jgi:inner membrane protein
MDSISHILVGGALGQLIAGKKMGRKAILIGALAKTAPDFDVFFTSQKNPMSYLCNHRAYSHALPVQFIAAILLAYACSFLWKKKYSFKLWFILLLSCFWGHSLLDTCTAFGTQLMLPFNHIPYSWNNISVADLFFTTPLFILFFILVFSKNNSTIRNNTSKIMLGYVFCYLAWTFGNKWVVNDIFKKSMSENKITHVAYLSGPTILNNFLWFALAKNDTSIFVSEYSLFNKNRNLKWTEYPMQLNLLDSLENSKPKEVALWHSNGYVLVRKNEDTTQFYTIKFGPMDSNEKDEKKAFGFYYKVYKDTNGLYQLGANDIDKATFDFKKEWHKLWKKVFIY